MSPRDRVAQLYPQVPNSLSDRLYDSQGYGGCILTHLHTGILKLLRNFKITLLTVVYGRPPSKISIGFRFPMERYIINS
jgi:hypothetical protein